MQAAVQCSYRRKTADARMGFAGHPGRTNICAAVSVAPGLMALHADRETYIEFHGSRRLPEPPGFLFEGNVQLPGRLLCAAQVIFYRKSKVESRKSKFENRNVHGSFQIIGGLWVLVGRLHPLPGFFLSWLADDQGKFGCYQGQRVRGLLHGVGGAQSSVSFGSFQGARYSVLPR